MSRRDLAAYQAALSELLVRQPDPAVIAHALTTEPAFAPYRAYVASFEPHLIELVARLSVRWSARASG